MSRDTELNGSSVSCTKSGNRWLIKRSKFANILISQFERRLTSGLLVREKGVTIFQRLARRRAHPRLRNAPYPHPIPVLPTCSWGRALYAFVIRTSITIWLDLLRIRRGWTRCKTWLNVSNQNELWSTLRETFLVRIRRPGRYQRLLSVCADLEVISRADREK